MLAGGEQHKECQFRTNEAFTWARSTGHGQVGHGIRCGMNPSQAASAATGTTCDCLELLQPITQTETDTDIHTYIHSNNQTFKYDFNI